MANYLKMSPVHIDCSCQLEIYFSLKSFIHDVRAMPAFIGARQEMNLGSLEVEMLHYKWLVSVEFIDILRLYHVRYL